MATTTTKVTVAVNQTHTDADGTVHTTTVKIDVPNGASAGAKVAAAGA